MINKHGLVLHVQRCGATADALLARAVTFKVLAVFQRSIYLQACLPPTVAKRGASDSCFQPDIICIVDPLLGDGPLHCCVPGLAATEKRYLKVGARLSNDRESRILRLGADTKLHYAFCDVLDAKSRIPVNGNLAAAQTWISPGCLQCLYAASLASFQTSPNKSFCIKALGWLVETEFSLERCFTGVKPVDTHYDSHDALASCCRDIYRLQTSTRPSIQFAGILGMLGTGTGLTPSGDDFICGVIAAFYLTDKAPYLDELKSVLVSTMLSRTHPISAAHLYEACCGNANDASMAIITALAELLLMPQEPHAEVAKLMAACDSMGASSGWDFLAGMVVALHIGQSRTAKSMSPMVKLRGLSCSRSCIDKRFGSGLAAKTANEHDALH